MKNMQYNRYYRNGSVIVDLLWGVYCIPQNVFLVEYRIIREEDV